MSLSIRDATLEDAELIAHNNAAMALETEHKLLDAATVRLRSRCMLFGPSKGTYFVAVDETGAVVGQLMITHEWSDWRNGDFWWIQSVYVSPTARRKGVFRALYRTRRRPRACDARRLRHQAVRGNR